VAPRVRPAVWAPAGSLRVLLLPLVRGTTTGTVAWQSTAPVRAGVAGGAASGLLPYTVSPHRDAPGLCAEQLRTVLQLRPPLSRVVLFSSLLLLLQLQLQLQQEHQRLQSG
jgi:hypothetical protein